MRRLLPIVMLLGSLVYASASATDYWPMPDGEVYHYVNDQGDSLWVSFSAGNRTSQYYNGSYYCWIWEKFADDGSGDVMFGGSIPPVRVEPMTWGAIKALYR